MIETKRKKHCLNCKHLSYEYGDVGDDEGFACNKRVYKYELHEMKHLAKLRKDKYLVKPKNCCELKEPTHD